MKILGIDTSSRFLALGVLSGSSSYEYNLEVGNRLSGILVATIKRVLDALDCRPSEIDYLACGVGPGSFTGLRVGMAAIKGMGWAVDKPIIPIPSLDILAGNFPASSGLVVPVVDAKRNLLYTCIYRLSSGRLKRISPFMLITPEELSRKIRKITSQAHIYLLGDGVHLCQRQEKLQRLNIKVLDKDYWYPRGRNIIELAKEHIKERKIKDAFTIEPIYLYPKECQIRTVI